MKGLYKGTFRKLLAAMTALGLTLTGVVSASAAGGSQKAKGETEILSETEAEGGSETESEGTSSGKTKDDGDGAEKDETVYIFTDASGNQKSLIVSDWLKNLKKDDSLKYFSDLTGIENVKGDETFTQNGPNLTWAAGGNDIYYQGNSDKKAPVGVKITYTLDGKQIDPKNLAGKSGHLKIHFEYTNNETKTETVDGKKITVKVPFGVMSGLLLTEGSASNVTVSSGKVIQEGDSTAVVGLAFPGLRESLALSDDKDLDIDDSKIPESIDVEADVTDFSMDMNMTIVMDDVLDSVLDEFDEGSSFDKVQDQVSDLKDASKKLVDGTSDLYDGTNDLKDGTSDLKDGTSKLKDGAGDLEDGAGDLKDGLSEYTNGVSQVYDGTKKLKSGTSQLKSGASSLADGTGELQDGAVSLRNGAKQLKDGAKALSSGASSANSGAARLESGAQALSTGAKQADSGAAALKSGAAQLSDGADQLKDGTKKLSAGAADLKNGTDTAAAGAALSGALLAGKIGRQRLICGLVCGAFYSLCLLAAAVLAHGVPSWTHSDTMLPLALLLGGTLGGALSAVKEGR